MKTIFAVVLALAGCYGAHRNDSTSGDDEPPVCGSTTCDQKPANTCVDGDTLREYDAECSGGTCSYPSKEVECGGDGCCGDHCCTITPSNANDFGELKATGLVVAPPNGTFDTDAECVSASALGKCEPVTRGDLPQACVCRADEMTIGELEVTGSRALVLLVKEKITITTLLDVSGNPGTPGPGSTYKYADKANNLGGVGGSYATKGAGASGDNNVAAVYGDPQLVPLLGGMDGRGGGQMKGGGGGGALQITAGERIEVKGVINAGGGGGTYGYGSYGSGGGGGGGSGGSILLEAPTVVVTGTAVANGGGGGGAGGSRGSGSNGWDAGTTKDSLGIPVDPMIAAYGGPGTDGDGCPLYGYVSGGDGGVGAVGTSEPGYGGYSDYDSRCFGSASWVGGGGGGGGVGRIRVNTSNGCQCGGKISPSATFGTLVKQ